MKSTMFFTVFLIAFSIGLTSQAQTYAIPVATKKICDTYFATDFSGQTPESQVTAITDLINVAYQLNFDATQIGKLKSKFMEVLGINPNKLQQFHNMAYGACMTEMSEDDYQQARAAFANHIK